MQRTTLGRDGPAVSGICLGTMTWGSQNTAEEGHAQIDRALERGVDFLDTAEMYPTTPSAPETVGRTEEIVGGWVAKSGRRNEVVLATKMLGGGSRLARDGAPVTGASLARAVEESLRRLRTDVIDLFQLHWPDRGSYHFRQHWRYAPGGSRAEVLAHMQDVLEAADRLRAAGKLRHFGLSNETAWGMAQWLRLGEEQGLPRAVSVQNEYSLLARLHDTDLAELGVFEGIALMAYSPLAAGLLTGKYAGDVTPSGSRRSVNPTLGGRITPRVWEAIAAYRAVAAAHGLDPVQMALAWTRTRPFPVIPIIGATSMAQLDTALGAVDLTLSAETVEAIEAVHKAHPLPY